MFDHILEDKKHSFASNICWLGGTILRPRSAAETCGFVSDGTQQGSARHGDLGDEDSATWFEALQSCSIFKHFQTYLGIFGMVHCYVGLCVGVKRGGAICNGGQGHGAVA